MNVEKFVDGLHAYLQRQFAPFITRLEALELRAPQKGEDGKDGAPGERGEPGPQGPPGADGKSVELTDVQHLIEQAVRGLPPPKDGRDGVDGKDGAPGPAGPQGERGPAGADGKSVELNDLHPLIEQAVRNLPPPKDGRDGIDGKDGAPGERGAPGEPGADGKSVTIDEVFPDLSLILQRHLSALSATVQQHIEAMPVPKDGKDGAPGRDGRDGVDGVDGKGVTVDDFRQLFDAQLAKTLLELERRGMDLIQRCIERIEKPKDGKDGRDGIDGKDGISYEEIVSEYDGRRTLTMVGIRGEERRVIGTHKLAVILDEGVHRQGQLYEKGAAVTFGGSLWIAQRDTTDKPGQSDAWRLAVKRGRDGKDAK